MTKTIMAKTTAKSNGKPVVSAGAETVAEILERERERLIHEWLGLVEKQEDLMSIKLSYEDRTGHLPQLLSDVIAWLHLDSSTKAPISVAASHHGDLRRKQGYSVAMVVEESRLLQVCLSLRCTRIPSDWITPNCSRTWSPSPTRWMPN